MYGINIWGRDWEEAVANSDFALLPLASFEYHGPMAPLGTDPAIANAVAEYAQKTYRCIAYPTVYYTTCPQKTQGAPTISIAPPTMLSYLIDVLKGIYAAGFSRVMILNAHDGNMSMARAAAEAIAGPSHTLVVWGSRLWARAGMIWGAASSRGGMSMSRGSRSDSSAMAARSPRRAHNRVRRRCKPLAPHSTVWWQTGLTLPSK